jgi:glycosyltransferase involved in cell wall biosynthesis
MKILFLLRCLDVGGAERRAVMTARGLQEQGHRVAIATFYGGGELEKELIGSDVRLINLEKRNRWDLLGFLRRFFRMIRQERPEILYSFLSGPNILAALTAPFWPRTKLIWALCASNMDFSRYDWLVRWAHWLETRLSPLPCLIISNSEAGRIHAIAQGFPASKIKIIHNGFDTERFRPNREARQTLRKEWNIPEDSPLIGLIGRLDPMKGHECFLRAAAGFVRSVPNGRFICVGEGPSDYRERLSHLAERLGLREQLIWSNHRTDLNGVYNALDILVSASSYGEGLSNVLGEAMAAGTPCIVTEVGDAARVVGTYGSVVPPDHPERLTEAMLAMWQRITAGSIDPEALRQRVEQHFSLTAMIIQTAAILQER